VFVCWGLMLVSRSLVSQSPWCGVFRCRSGCWCSVGVVMAHWWVVVGGVGDCGAAFSVLVVVLMWWRWWGDVGWLVLASSKGLGA
jgi:hypothetical protein